MKICSAGWVYAFCVLAASGCKTMEESTGSESTAASAVGIGEHVVSVPRAVFAQRAAGSVTNPLTARPVLLNEGDTVMVTGFSGTLAEVSLADGRRGYVERNFLKERPIEPEDVLVPVLGEDYVKPAFPVSRPGPPPVPVPRSLIEEANDLEMPSVEP